MQSKKLHVLLATVTAAVLVAACGGGGDAAGPRTQVSRVYVAGDSLADVGAESHKYTVQRAADPAEGYPLYPEIVAANFGINDQCNYYTEPTNDVFVATNLTCTNFAVESARIVSTNGAKAVVYQLNEMGTRVGTFSSTDLIVVDGGGNDAQDLAGLVLAAQAAPGPATQNALATYLAQAGVITPAELGTVPGAQLPGLYMQRLADAYYNAVKTNLLDRGATHVALLNMPDITVIPGFRLQTGGSQAAQDGIRTLVQVFNTRLRDRVGTDSRIALVDFYADLQDEVANYTTYGLTNATDAACDAIAAGTSSVNCTDAALDALPGRTPGWWRTYAFADRIHPTPFGQQLLAASVNRAIARAGWL